MPASRLVFQYSDCILLNLQKNDTIPFKTDTFELESHDKGEEIRLKTCFEGNWNRQLCASSKLE